MALFYFYLMLFVFLLNLSKSFVCREVPSVAGPSGVVAAASSESSDEDSSQAQVATSFVFVPKKHLVGSSSN